MRLSQEDGTTDLRYADANANHQLPGFELCKVIPPWLRAAEAIAAMLRDRAPGEPKFVNTCYSLVAPDYGVSVAMVYGYRDGKIVKVEGAGGLSPLGAPQQVRQLEADYADGWYLSISRDIWG